MNALHPLFVVPSSQTLYQLFSVGGGSGVGVKVEMQKGGGSQLVVLNAPSGFLWEGIFLNFLGVIFFLFLFLFFFFIFDLISFLVSSHYILFIFLFSFLLLDEPSSQYMPRGKGWWNQRVCFFNYYFLLSLSISLFFSSFSGNSFLWKKEFL